MTPTPEDIALAARFANGRPWIVPPLAEAIAAHCAPLRELAEIYVSSPITNPPDQFYYQ